MNFIKSEQLSYIYCYQNKNNYRINFLPERTHIFQAYVRDYQQAWEQIKEAVNDYRFCINFPYKTILIEYIRSIVFDVCFKDLTAFYGFWEMLCEQLTVQCEKRRLMLFIHDFPPHQSREENCRMIYENFPTLAILEPYVQQVFDDIQIISNTLKPFLVKATITHTIDPLVAKTVLSNRDFTLWSSLPDTALVTIEIESGYRHRFFLTQTETGTLVNTFSFDSLILDACKEIGINNLNWRKSDVQDNDYVAFIRNKFYTQSVYGVKGEVDLPSFVYYEKYNHTLKQI